MRASDRRRTIGGSRDRTHHLARARLDRAKDGRRVTERWRDEVRAYQAAKGLQADGDVGERTWAALMRDIGNAPTALVPAPSPGKFSFGGEPMRGTIDRNPHKLISGFAAKVEQLFQRMRARGFDPLLWEGYRSPERAAELAARGVGVVQSMHCYGAAVDIVERTALWSASAAFWDALGQEAEALGLTWGGRFSRVDLPHVQLVPVREQAALRAMTPEQRSQLA